MKIIARIDGDRVLIEATDKEVARIMGEHSAWSIARDQGKDTSKFPKVRLTRDDRFMVGTEIEVNACWDFLDSLRAKERSLKDAANIFRSMATMLDNGVPTALVCEKPEGEG